MPSLTTIIQAIKDRQAKPGISNEELREVCLELGYRTYFAEYPRADKNTNLTVSIQGNRYAANFHASIRYDEPGLRHVLSPYDGTGTTEAESLQLLYLNLLGLYERFSGSSESTKDRDLLGASVS